MEAPVDQLLDALALYDSKTRTAVLRAMSMKRRDDILPDSALPPLLDKFKEHAHVGRDDDVEAAFIELVSKDSGGLRAVLIILARALHDGWLERVVRETPRARSVPESPKRVSPDREAMIGRAWATPDSRSGREKRSVEHVSSVGGREETALGRTSLSATIVGPEGDFGEDFGLGVSVIRRGDVVSLRLLSVGSYLALEGSVDPRDTSARAAAAAARGGGVSLGSESASRGDLLPATASALATAGFGDEPGVDAAAIRRAISRGLTAGEAGSSEAAAAAGRAVWSTALSLEGGGAGQPGESFWIDAGGAEIWPGDGLHHNSILTLRSVASGRLLGVHEGRLQVKHEAVRDSTLWRIESQTKRAVESSEGVVLRHVVSGGVLGVDGDGLPCCVGEGGGGGTWALVCWGGTFVPGWSRALGVLDEVESTGGVGETERGGLVLDGLPWAGQEAILVEDCLAGLQGLAGETTRVVDEEMVLVSRVDAGLGALATRILKVGTAGRRCRRLAKMLDCPEAGRVAQAAAAAARELLNETDLLVAQLETLLRESSSGSSLGLSRVWFLVQPVGRSLETLAAALDGREKGGALVRSLHRQWLSAADESSRAVLRFLLERAATPLLEQLHRWLFRGELGDPRNEFLIRERRGSDLARAGLALEPGSRHWEDRFELDVDACPAFLQPLAQRILETGRCIDALRNCSVPAQGPVGLVPRESSAPPSGTTKTTLWSAPNETSEIAFATDASAYEPLVAAAHAFATKGLRDFVLREGRLAQRLDGMRDVFLLRQGDYVVHFLETAADELAKEIPAQRGAPVRRHIASLSRLRPLLELSLRAARPEDALAASVTCALESRPLAEQLEMVHAGVGAAAAGAAAPSRDGRPPKAYASITLDVAVCWPLSLVLHRRSIFKYQVLFRHLLFHRHVERALGLSWMAHQACKELDLGPYLAASWALRQRMLHLVHNLLFFMTVEVIEPAHHELAETLRDAPSIDAIRIAHEEFLNTTLAGCLLADPAVLRPLTKLVTLCLFFANRMTEEMDSHRPDDEDVAREAGLGTPPAARRRRRTSAQHHDADEERDKARIRRAAMAAKRRQARLSLQSESMRHTMEQAGWQAMIRKSEALFNKYKEQFLRALASRAQGDARSPVAHLLSRLDFNGYYSRTLRL